MRFALVIVILFRNMGYSFPDNLYSKSDIEIFRPIQIRMRGDGKGNEVEDEIHEYVIRWNEEWGLIWVENQNTEDHYIFCDRNSTVTTRIRSPSNVIEYTDPRNKFPTKICLFDGLCDIDYPEFELIRFYKKEKYITTSGGTTSKVYQFQSHWNYYLDLDLIQSDKNPQNDRVINQNVRLCRSDQSYQQLFQPIIYDENEKKEL